MANKILVVEDEQDLLTNLKELLEMEGHQVFSAQDVGSALNIVFSTELDLIIADLKLGARGDEGLLLLNRVKQDRANRDTPFLLVTANVDRRTIVRAMKAGTCDYITKPYSRNELLEAIASCFHTKKKKKHDTTQCLIRVTSPGVSNEAIALQTIHTVGRLETATTRVLDRKVSRIACTFQRMGRSNAIPYYAIVDGQILTQGTNNPSANGVRINGQRIDNTATLKSGDVIQLSPQTWIDYQVIDEEEKENDSKTLT